MVITNEEYKKFQELLEKEKEFDRSKEELCQLKEGGISAIVDDLYTDDGLRRKRLGLTITSDNFSKGLLMRIVQIIEDRLYLNMESIKFTFEWKHRNHFERSLKKAIEENMYPYDSSISIENKALYSYIKEKLSDVLRIKEYLRKEVIELREEKKKLEREIKPWWKF